MNPNPVSAELAPGLYRWSDLRAHALSVLTAAGVDSPEAEARWLVERAAGGAEVWAEAGETAPAKAVGHVIDMLEQRAAGRPLQYVLGRWAFRRLELVVDHRVLIPRVETEVVAEVALAETGRFDSDDLLVADLGTGSGVLALALVDELPGVVVWATDVSPDALSVARANLAAVGLAATRVRLAEGSWFEALPGELRGSFHVIVSNPPYVSEEEYAALPPEVRDFEPRQALVSGPTGVEDVEEIVGGAREWLVPGGALVCELSPPQAGVAAELARRAGFEDVEVRADLSGRDRVLVGRSARA